MERDKILWCGDSKTLEWSVSQKGKDEWHVYRQKKQKNGFGFLCYLYHDCIWLVVDVKGVWFLYIFLTTSLTQRHANFLYMYINKSKRILTEPQSKPNIYTDLWWQRTSTEFCCPHTRSKFSLTRERLITCISGIHMHIFPGCKWGAFDVAFNTGREWRLCSILQDTEVHPFRSVIISTRSIHNTLYRIINVYIRTLMIIIYCFLTNT